MAFITKGVTSSPSISQFISRFLPYQIPREAGLTLQRHGKNPLSWERLFPLTPHRHNDCNAQSAAITRVAEVLPKDLFTLCF